MCCFHSQGEKKHSRETKLEMTEMVESTNKDF